MTEEETKCEKFDTDYINYLAELIIRFFEVITGGKKVTSQ